MEEDKLWKSGFSSSELDQAEDIFQFEFPPDLRTLLLDRSPINGHNWANPEQLRTAFSWPYDGLLFDIEHNNFWLSAWGVRPALAEERAELLRFQINNAPKLIPLTGHRYLPAEPSESGNPVFSVYQSDIIYYGKDLADFFKIEFSSTPRLPAAEECRRIRFWSDLIE
jgi:hypothetical protein